MNSFDKSKKASLQPRRDYRRPVPDGTASFVLAIKDIRVAIVSLPTAWEPFVRERYHPFAEPYDASMKVDLEIHVKQSAQRTVVPLPPPEEMTVLEIAFEKRDRLRIRSHWQDGYIDIGRGRGELVLTDRAWDRFAMSVENFLRVAFQIYLISRNAFLMHTAGVIDDGRVFLFFGPSGAGKSTATANSLPRHALSDDMVMIDVSGDEPRACSVPFFMVFPPEQRMRGAWPIAAALRIRQAPQDRLEAISLARSVATVSASVPFVHELGVPHEGLTELVARFCSKIPVADLHLTKTPTFWSLLNESYPSQPKDDS